MEEAADKGRADSLIFEAFDRVRSYLRTYDASGLVGKQNAEYGALRNLFAVRNVFTIESTACLIGSVILWRFFRKPGYLWSAAVASCYLILGVVVGWRLLPRMVALAAETYGKNAWLAFLKSPIGNRRGKGASEPQGAHDRNCKGEALRVRLGSPRVRGGLRERGFAAYPNDKNGGRGVLPHCSSQRFVETVALGKSNYPRSLSTQSQHP